MNATAERVLHDLRDFCPQHEPCELATCECEQTALAVHQHIERLERQLRDETERAERYAGMLESIEFRAAPPGV